MATGPSAQAGAIEKADPAFDAIVPADAKIWFDGTATTTTGSVRQFGTPPLKPGSQSSYEIRARWNENGQEMDQTQHVQAGRGGRLLLRGESAVAFIGIAVAGILLGAMAASG